MVWEPSDGELLALAPPIFQELARFVPIRDLYALAAKFGGSQIRIPKTGPARVLATVVGDGALRALCAYFGGDYFVVPRAHRFRLAVRNRVITESLLAGRSINQVALDHQMTRRNVRMITRKLKSRSPRAAAWPGKPIPTKAGQ